MVVMRPALGFGMGLTVCKSDVQIVIGQSVIRVVEEVEELGAELYAESFRIFVSFNKAMSVSLRCGPRRVSRPKLPSVPIGARTKAAGLNH